MILALIKDVASVVFEALLGPVIKWVSRLAKRKKRMELLKLDEEEVNQKYDNEIAAIERMTEQKRGEIMRSALMRGMGSSSYVNDANAELDRDMNNEKDRIEKARKLELERLALKNKM